MKKYLVSASIAGIGFLGGAWLGSGHNDLLKVVGFGLGGGLIAGAPVAFFYDTKVNGQTRKISELQETVKRFNNKLNEQKIIKQDAETLTKNTLNRVLILQEALEIITGELEEITLNESQFISKLNHQITELQTQLKQAKQEKTTYIIECQATQDDLIKSHQQQQDELLKQCQGLQKTCDEKENELQVFARDYNDNLSKEFEAKKREVVASEIAKEFELTSQAFEVMDELQTFVKQIYERHQGQRDQLLGTNGKYHEHLQKVIDQHNEAYQELMQVKESLELRVRFLQQTIDEGVTAPVYIDAAFDDNQKIANRIAKELFEDFGLPLAVQGTHTRPDGIVDIGYGYSKTTPHEVIVQKIVSFSKELAGRLKIHKITSVRKLEIADCIVVSFRREPALKESDVKLMIGSAEEFLDYITSQPIRYRLIADPGTGKTPTTAVMVSAILKEGATMGNTGKGAKIPNTLVTVSYPDGNNSQKDLYYPLAPFLKYGDTTAAIKSIADAVGDWEYRKHNTKYAANFFQLWVWDELDNTLNSCSDPKGTAEQLKQILKQAHHTGVGFIVSGQSVMTKQIPGFTNDDRSLFTEIIIGIPKIRKYLEVYGKSRNSQTNLNRLAANLDDLEEFIEDKNKLVTDDARLLRIALVVDSRSPKLYYLPNLDLAKFDTVQLSKTSKLADAEKRVILAGTADMSLTRESSNPDEIRTGTCHVMSSNPTIGGLSNSDTIPHCPHCGEAHLRMQSDKRYYCLSCKKRFVESKAVW